MKYLPTPATDELIGKSHEIGCKEEEMVAKTKYIKGAKFWQK